MVAPRATRTNTGAAVTPMAIMALVRSGPRNAASAMARIRNGQASMASTTRPTTASTRPPANPASSPTGTPMPPAISTDTTPASSDARVPNTTRDSTSRPFSSVPIGCCQDGALRMAVQLVATGSYGDTSGAATATPTNTAITTRPSTAAGRVRNRASASRAGLLRPIMPSAAGD